MTLAVKLLLTPFFIAAVSLAGRRWGPAVSGVLIGLPLTSAPISIILALQYGPAFAASAAAGNLAGQASMCIFGLVYSLVARRTNWLVSTLAAGAVFALATLFWDALALALLPAFLLVMAVIAVVGRLIPARPIPAGAVRMPRWDLPARMIVATVFVYALTSWAEMLGPRLSGLLAPFPIFGSVLAAFAHRQQGAEAAAQVLRGLVLGSSAYACFFLVTGALLTHLPTGWVYVLAGLAALAVNAVFLLRGAPT